MTIGIRRSHVLAMCLSLTVLACFVNRASAADANTSLRWRELGDPVRADAAMVWDSRRGRAMLFGGDGDGNFAAPSPGVWQLVSAPPSHWERVTTQGDEPAPRSGWVAVYDSLRDRVLLSGGRAHDPERGTPELWELRLSGSPTWSQLDVSAGPVPPSRFDAFLALDAQDRLVLFGGDGEAKADSGVWLLSLAESPLRWRAVELPGPGPGPRARFGAAYSALTNRLVVFGGDHHLPPGGNWLDSYPQCPAATWELALDEPIHWIARAAAPADSVPLPEVGGPMVADAAGRFAWLFPGDQGFRGRDTSVWRYDFASGGWERVGANTTRYWRYASASAWS